MRPVIQSEKHLVQITLSSVVALDSATETIVNAVQDVTPGNPRHVPVGAIVKAVYVELWLLGTGQQPNTTTVIVEKTPGSSRDTDITATEMGDLHGYFNKKNILETHQGLIGDANTNPVPFFRGWIKIPKGKQRFGLGDRFQLSIKAITEDVQYCAVFIYKAYT